MCGRLTSPWLDRSGTPPGARCGSWSASCSCRLSASASPFHDTALRHGGRALGDTAELDGPALVEVLTAALAAVQDLGAAEPGDKTMVDALGPALDGPARRIEAGDPLEAALAAAADAADEGARATTPMQARKGRASYLGERSVGHQDPGATSTALIVRALGTAFVTTG